MIFAHENETVKEMIEKYFEEGNAGEIKFSPENKDNEHGNVVMSLRYLALT